MKALVAVLAMLLLSPASAAGQEVEVGTGIICDTAQQLEQYVSVLNETRSNEAALIQVNADAPGETNVCAIAPVAYKRGKTIKRVQTLSGPADIVEIEWVGVPAGQMGPVLIIQPLPQPVVQYTLFTVKGEDV